jgi:hypothetical protein
MNLAHAGMRAPHRRTCRTFDKFPTPCRTSRVGRAGAEWDAAGGARHAPQPQDVLAATEQTRALHAFAPPDSKSPARTRSGRGFFVPASASSGHILPPLAQTNRPVLASVGF